jgi:REP element-mobilizing transposase RayT
MPRKPKTIAFWVGRLPHWEVEDGKYFVTIHVAGAIPEIGRERLRLLSDEAGNALAKSPSIYLALQRAIFREMEKWLDRAQWNPKLQNPLIANMLIESIEHRCRQNIWQIDEFVIMPTHVHLFGRFSEGDFKKILEDFKRWTGRQAAAITGEEPQRFWQREWFDHWSRSEQEDEKIVHYIRNNPVKAGLVSAPSQWPFSSLSRSRPPDGTSALA